MNTLEEQLLIKENELKALACELAELLKVHSSKQEHLEQISKSLPVLEKKLKKKTEILAQEHKDNELISSRIISLEAILNGKPDASRDSYIKFYKDLHRSDKNQDHEEFKSTDFDFRPSNPRKASDS